MIYLIGVDHQAQYDITLPVSKEFSNYLEEKASQLKITMIAEEFSKELLNEYKVPSTIAENVARKLRIGHRYCDPSKEEKDGAGIHSREDDAKREQFWLDKIVDKKDEQIIFVCGSCHLPTFGLLVLRNGIGVKILDKRFDTWH